MLDNHSHRTAHNSAIAFSRAATIGRPRFVPMVGDSMTPTLKDGDFAAVVQTETYNFEGLYVLEFLSAPDVYRCAAMGPGKIRISKDNERYPAHVLTLRQFEESVAGQVVAACSVIAPSLIDAVAGA